ncbi:MAG TPA: HAD family hydrolase [Anseongella sp.]|nr:HAD family hydrolase [Anseongella sp.]
MNKVVFLDKDGTLIENVPYNTDPGKIRFCPGVPEALRLLQEYGYKLIVVSNQAGVAYGFFKEEDLRTVKNALQERLAEYGVQLDGFYYCPHHIRGKVSRYALNCTCRKPMPGMLIRGAVEHGADLSSSWMIGDILDDIEAGNCAGCKTVLIDNGNETEWVYSSARRKPHFLVKDMEEAARCIISQAGNVKEGKRSVLYERPMQGYY